MTAPTYLTSAPLRRVDAPAPPRRATLPSAATWKSIGVHLLIPLFLAAGMAFAYLGAFHAPAPREVPVAIVGTTPQTQVFAQSLDDRAAGKLAVRTVATAAAARQLIMDQKISAAYEVAADHATVYESKAMSDAAAAGAESVFLPIAYQQHLPVQIVDVRAPTPQDPGGQSLFFLLVVLSVGSYAAAVAIAAATARLGIGWRMLVGAAVALVIAAVGVIVAGGVYHALNGNEWNIWLLGGLYSFGIIAIGIGLHPILGKWTTPVLTLLFVMLNFTSSGGIYPQYLAPAFFAGLNTFWNGAAWLDAARALTYFPAQSIGFDALRLSLWAAAAVLLVVVVHLAERSRRAVADESRDAIEAETDLVVAG